MKSLFLFFVALFPVFAFANSVEDKTRKLFEVQGILTIYQDLIDQTRSQAMEEAKQMTDQMLSQLNPPKVFQDKFSKAIEKYTKALLTDRTAEQVVDIQIQYYSTRFSEEEIDQLISFYGSELGQKDIAVSKDSYQHLIEHYKAENDLIRVSATNEFMNDIQLIKMECNCAKKPMSKKKR